MELRQAAKGKYFLSTLFTVFIILIIALLGPVNAVNISLSSSDINPQYNQVVNFTAGIDLTTNERVPINYVKAVVKDSLNNIVSSCDFDVNGVKLANCSSSFESITLSSLNSAYNQGNLTADNNGTAVDYGYGYGYVYGSSIFEEIKYDIAYRTPTTIKNTSESYSISLEVYTGANTVNSVIKSNTPVVITVEMDKPIAQLSDTNLSFFESEDVLIDASPSYDPNSFDLTNYEVYDSSNNLIAQSPTPQFQITGLSAGINTLDLVVVNQYNITSVKTQFTVEIKSNFNANNLELIVDDFISQSTINFQIVSNYSFQNKVASVNPRLVCINIPIDLKNSFDEKISFKSTRSEYNFNVDINDFDVTVPIDNSCTFYVDLVDEVTNESITLSKAVIFRNEFSQGVVPITVELNHGADISGYIYQGFDKGFNKGYNALTYNFRNNGATPIKIEMQVSIQDLSIDHYEEFSADSNQDTEVMIPLFINDNVKSGKYPVRISYRVNEEELKVKYGYILVN